MQELVAPEVVEFFSREGDFLGTTSDDLKKTIGEVTEIPLEALGGVSLADFSVNERRRWAAGRETKRREDKAYCLWGMFDVSMPPLYGEGPDAAFERLNDAIRKRWPLPRPMPGSSSATDRGGETSSSTFPGTTVQRRQDLLASLDFDQSESRQSTIKDAQAKTCEWILQHPQYISWNDRERQPREEVLWIVGKPGTGKSTMMKFVLARARKNKPDDQTILSFFFNARGGNLEKTVLGMYRSLLFQLLEVMPDLHCILDETNPAAKPRWTHYVLQSLMRAAIEGLGQRRLRMFIDALDECDEDQIRDMVDFFEDIAEDANGRLDICFASRHYPTIKVNHSCRLILEDEQGHNEDVATYIRRHLQTTDRKFVNDFQEELQSKANGIFMWVVLVVDILNKDIRAGERGTVIKKRLNELPSELSQLFKRLLGKDDTNKNGLLLCCQWILFARRPLKPEEFYFAMEAGGVDDADAAGWQPDPWDQEDVTNQTMRLFVLNSSKGLVELTKSKTKPTVQFIHESVRDFLLKDRGLCELSAELSPDPEALSHEKLKECCSRYMTADAREIYQPEAFSNASTPAATISRQRLFAEFPFLDYASQHVLYHADEAARRVPQTDFLTSFPFPRWIRITNIFEVRQEHRHSPDATLVYITAENGLSRLLQVVNVKSSEIWLRLPDERYQLPAIAAFANGHRDALRILVGDESLVTRITKDPAYGKPSKVNTSPNLLRMIHGNVVFAQYLLDSAPDRSMFSSSERQSDGTLVETWNLV